jgi:hypothetical protein
MFKVSFKGDFRKVETFNDRATVVTLTGIMLVPMNVQWMPQSITDWLWTHESIDVTWQDNEHFRLKFSGKSVCSKDDAFDPVIGARIAECRAKIKLYKFIHTLCKKLMHFYNGILYGVQEGNGELHTTVISGTHEGLQDTLVKYTSLWVKESQHLGKLLEKA